METSEQNQNEDINLLMMGVVVEGGLVLLALLCAWFGFFAQEQTLGLIPSYSTADWIRIVGWGLLATIPMLIYLLVFHFWTPSFFQPMQSFIDAKLKPIFKNASLLEMLLLSLMAGFCEELFFRWCLQGGMTSFLVSKMGLMSALVVGVVISSLIFGGCHWVNATYGITTLLVGVYFGLVMIWTGSWLVPAIAHALFDFVAMIYIARSAPRKLSSWL